MDNPGISIFQGRDLQINNSKNIEEEEDLEDQLRRKEELQNLLQTNLDDFKYDDSTINSSANVSLASEDKLEQIYKDAISPEAQLKVLYDVRCREIQSLREEFERFKIEKAKEIESQKNQNMLLEAELRQLTMSLKNSENILVDKTGTINTLSKNLQDKDTQISKLEKLINDYESDLAAYKSELAELHIKLQSQNGPFNFSAKYNSEELRKSLQTKIEKLESAFDENVKKLDIYSAEKNTLQDEVARLAIEKVSLEKENDALLSNLDSAQQQCKDLIDVIEVLKHENDHFKARLNAIEVNKEEYANQAPTPGSQNEKLRMMLVDRSVELDSLKTKLRYYQNDLKELTEYRQLKCDVYKKEFQKCDNHSHTKELLLMQNELQNYRRIIEDKDQQILMLNSNNKDLTEKIEEMLLQTRHEIQNISSKYNMPQLDVMRKELEKAEYTEKLLSRKLEESEEMRVSLLQKLKSHSDQKIEDALKVELKKCRDDLKLTENMLANEQKRNREILNQLENQKTEALRFKNELEDLRLQFEKSKNSERIFGNNEMSKTSSIKSDYESLKLQLKNVMEHLEKNCKTSSSKKDYPEIIVEVKTQMDNFLEQDEKKTIEKGIIEEQITSWKKLLDQIELKDPDEVLKAQYKEAIMNLHTSEIKVRQLEDALLDMKTSLTVAEGDKCNLNNKLEEYAQELQNSKNSRNSLEKEIVHLKTLANNNDKEQKLPEITENKMENHQKDLNHLKEQLTAKENELKLTLEAIRRYEEERKERKNCLDKLIKEVERLKSDNSKLENQLHQAIKMRKGDKLDMNIEIDNTKKDNDFMTRLDEEVMKRELKLRDDLQIEYQKRINDIETRYQKNFKETIELCKQQKMELREQDNKFREYLKMILTECESCTTKLETEKLELAGQLQLVQSDYEKCKVAMSAQEEKYYSIIKKMERDSEKSTEAWKVWSKKVVCSCLDIEATNKKVRDRMLASMEQYDQEVATIQKLADMKIEKKLHRKEKI